MQALEQSKTAAEATPQLQLKPAPTAFADTRAADGQAAELRAANAPQTNGAGAKKSDNKFGISMNFTPEQMAVEKIFTLWKGDGLTFGSYPVGPGLLEPYATPNATVSWAHVINWANPGGGMAVMLRGGVSVGAKYGASELLSVFGEANCSAMGTGTLMARKGKTFDLTVKANVIGRLSLGIKLVGMVAKRFDAVSGEIARFTGIRVTEEGVHEDTMSFEWGEAIQEFIEWVKEQIALAELAMRVGKTAIKAAFLLKALDSATDAARKDPLSFFNALLDAQQTIIDDANTPTPDWGGWIELPDFDFGFNIHDWFEFRMPSFWDFF